jgi:hypothetical protein
MPVYPGALRVARHSPTIDTLWSQSTNRRPIGRCSCACYERRLTVAGKDEFFRIHCCAPVADWRGQRNANADRGRFSPHRQQGRHCLSISIFRRIGAQPIGGLQSSSSLAAAEKPGVRRSFQPVGKWSNVVNTRSNWCSDLSSVATAPLRSQWFGARHNTGHRPWW